jgi:prophage regulatory protein
VTYKQTYKPLPANPNRRLLRLVEVQAIVPFNKNQLRRLEQKDLFPKRIKLGERSIAWDAAEIEAWLEAKKAERKPGKQEAA